MNCISAYACVCVCLHVCIGGKIVMQAFIQRLATLERMRTYSSGEPGNEASRSEPQPSLSHFNFTKPEY